MSRVHAFEYRAPTAKNVRRMQDISDGCNDLAELTAQLVPPSAERTLAFRKLQEFRMWANVALVFDGQDSIFAPEDNPPPVAEAVEEPRFIDNHPTRQPFVYDKVDLIDQLDASSPWKAESEKLKIEVVVVPDPALVPPA